MLSMSRFTFVYHINYIKESTHPLQEVVGFRSTDTGTPNWAEIIGNSCSLRSNKSIAFTLQYLSFYLVKAALSHTNIYAFARESIDNLMSHFSSRFHRVTIAFYYNDLQIFTKVTRIMQESPTCHKVFIRTTIVNSDQGEKSIYGYSKRRNLYSRD